jgi:MOB kinase activator 1
MKAVQFNDPQPEKKPKSMPVPEHTGIFKLHLTAQATLGTADLRESVKLPAGIGEDEWIAAKMIGIFDEVEMTVSLLDDLCNETDCPTMQAGKKTCYTWADEETPTPVNLPAKVYMNTLVSYGNKMLSNQKIVPTDGSAFPSRFRPTMKLLLKRFFRVYAHMYLHHFNDIVAHDLEAHVNCCFKHFLYFVLEFDLVSMEDMNPLLGLIQKFLKPSAPEAANGYSGDSKPKDRSRRWHGADAKKESHRASQKANDAGFEVGEPAGNACRAAVKAEL